MTNPFVAFWDHGYSRLVPVIPPGVDISPRSSLFKRLERGEDSRGKAPGARTADGTWRGIQFVAMESQRPDLDVWNAWGASVGVKTGQGLVALDIDTTDRATAKKLHALAIETLGNAPLRFGRKPKCLLLYEGPHDQPYRQLRFSTPTEPQAGVELLSAGRQFVAHGVHPGTGKPYAWPNGVTPRKDLTHVTADQINAFFLAAASMLDDAVLTGHTAATDGVAAPDPESPKAPSIKDLIDTVAAIPNTTAQFPTRDDYIKVAYAIKAAAPTGHEAEALEAYLDWCARWDGGPEQIENDETIATEDWNRAVPPFRTGFPFLQNLAVSLLFQPIVADQTDDMFSANETAAGPAPKARNLKLFSMTDVFSMRPPKFLIARHLPESGFGLLFGDPGTGKSFMALDMGLHIAHGLPDWHSDAIQPRNGGRVLYIAGEGASGFQARISAWQAHTAELRAAQPTQPEDPPIRFVFDPINFMKHDDIRLLLKTANQFSEKWDMIVVDTVSRSIPGADENLQKDMTIFVAACDALRHATGAFVLGVHHTAKSGEMRGSSVFAGQADAIFRLARKKGSPAAILSCDKQKDAPDGWADTYTLLKVDGMFGASLVPTRAEPVITQGEVNKSLQERVLEAIATAWAHGEPWSMAPQSKQRYAVRRFAQDFDVRAEDGAACLDLWLQQGLVVSEMRDLRSRLVGLRVVGEDDTSSVGGEDATDEGGDVMS